MVLWGYELISKERMPFEYFGDANWYFTELFGSVIAATIANAFMTVCFANENPTTVSVLSQLQVGFNFLIDLLVFNLSFSTGQLIGMLVTLICSLGAGLYKMHSEKVQSV